MDSVLPLVEEGVARSEPTLLALHERNEENLRSALGGGEPEGVRLLSVEDWNETSARTRDKYARWALERAGPGRVRLVGEPPWALGSGAQVRDWARHESVLNVAFEGLPVTLLCPYDARVLPEVMLRHARSTHPEIADDDRFSESSERYEDPHAFCRRLDTDVRRPHMDPAVDVRFALADLPSLRRVVRSAAYTVGLHPSKADELALAVNEIATNAVVHGRLPAELRIWPTDAELVCEITDSGTGIEDVLAGQLAPAATAPGGRGIWLARLICDAVEIRNRAGCSVTLRIARSTAPVPV